MALALTEALKTRDAWKMPHADLTNDMDVGGSISSWIDAVPRGDVSPIRVRRDGLAALDRVYSPLLSASRLGRRAASSVPVGQQSDDSSLVGRGPRFGDESTRLLERQDVQTQAAEKIDRFWRAQNHRDPIAAAPRTSRGIRETRSSSSIRMERGPTSVGRLCFGQGRHCSDNESFRLSVLR